MGGSLTSPNKIKDVYKKLVFYEDNKFKTDNGTANVVITTAENFASDTEATLTNKTIDADNNTISNLEVDNLKSGVLDTDLSSVAETDTTLVSAKAIKNYVDTQIAAITLDALSNLNITSPVEGALLSYNSSSSEWIDVDGIDGGEFNG